MRVLVVEDDPAVAAAMVRALRRVNVLADIGGTGSRADELRCEAAYDVIVLDAMLPDRDGFDLCRSWRAAGDWTPVIMVTARADVQDRVRGLDAGADDYLTKPFALSELLARLRALTRREATPRPSVMSVGKLTLDPGAARVWHGDAEVQLTPREFALLETFMRSPEQVLSHLQLIDAAWELGFVHRSNVVEVYIRYLRHKIDRPFGTHHLQTVRGLGYRLTAGSAM